MTDVNRRRDDGGIDANDRQQSPSLATVPAIQRDVCWALADEGPTTRGAVRRALGTYYDDGTVDETGVEGALDALVENGLVDVCECDDRSDAYRLTTTGRRALSLRRVWIERRCTCHRR